MNVEDIKTLNDIQIVKEQSNKVLKQIAEEISQLKLAKEENLLSEREYNKEAQSREKIKKHAPSCGCDSSAPLASVATRCLRL